MTPTKTLSILIRRDTLRAAWRGPQAIELAHVVSKQTSRMAELPGEFLPFLSVSLHAKVPGYLERILVDRGSRVERGQLLAELSAPEMAAPHFAEAEAKVTGASSRTGCKQRHSSPARRALMTG